MMKDDGQIFEDYVSKIIHSKLLPLLEKQTEEVRTEIEKWTESDWKIFSLANKNDRMSHSVHLDHGVHEQNWLNGHTNHLLPLVMSLRVLLSLSRDRGQPYVPYDEFISRTYDVGLKFKTHLIEVQEGKDGFFERGLTNGLPWSANELELSNRGGSSRKTNTPIAYREKRSKEQFHQYYTSVKPDSKYPGILVLLGLVHLDAESGSAWRIRDRTVALTERGYKLAMYGNNPLLDDYRNKTPAFEIQSTLSEHEQYLILNAINEHCPLEARRMWDILTILHNGEGKAMIRGFRRRYLLEQIKMNDYESFEHTRSEQTLNKELSAILSRMQNLGLIVQESKYLSGTSKSFTCTIKGIKWRSEQKHF